MNSRLVVLLSAVIVMLVGLPFVLAKQARDGRAVATTAEVQEFDRLWRDFEGLQSKAFETGDTVFKRSVVTRTGQYLKFEGDQEERFSEAVDLALMELKGARIKMQDLVLRASKISEKPAAIRLHRAGWSEWQQEQRLAADRLLASLHSSPRHRLFAEKRLLWLLRLDHQH